MPSLEILNKSTLFATARQHMPSRRTLRGDGAPPRLKGFQDAMAFGHIMQHYNMRNRAPLSVADVGGDQSRVLPFLLERGSNITGTITDTWSQSIGNGTIQIPDPQTRISLIDTLVGTPEAHEKIQDNSFNVVTSISVVEHIPANALEAFFSDCLRICKPGGIILHYIDLHISDSNQNERGTATAAALEAAYGPLKTSPNSWAFKSKYVSNPDSMMFNWGERMDNMEFRANNQAVCLVARHDCL